MNLALFVGWLVCLVVGAFTAFAVVYGAGSMRSPRWREAFHQLGREIVREHGLHARQASTAEQNAALTLLGHWDGGTPGTADRRLGVIEELVGGPKRFDRADLERRHGDLLGRVIRRQRQAAADKPTIQAAARAWRVALLRNHLDALWQGTRWFLPRFLGHIRPIGERALTSATLVGAWFGLLYWGISSYVRRASGQPPTDWLQVVGVVITLSCVVALAMAVARPLLAVIQHLVHVGRGRNAWAWTVATALALAALAFAATRSNPGELVRGPQVSLAAALALLGAAVWTVAKGARDSRLKVSARLENALFAAAFLAVGALLGARRLGADAGLERGLRMAIVALLVATAVPVVVERVVEYLRLRRAGRQVPVAVGASCAVVWVVMTAAAVVLLREAVVAWLRDGQVGQAVAAGLPVLAIALIWLAATAALAWPIRRAWIAVERAHNELALERAFAEES